MATKQKWIEEFDSMSAATLSESANIHGVAANILPLKPGKCAKFFEMKITNVAKMMRMADFQSHQQNQLATYHAKPVALHNCKVKPACQLQELQVLMKSNTELKAHQENLMSTSKTLCRMKLL